MDPTTHPDLVEVGRTMRRRLDRVLDAEMVAARAAMARRRSMRDRLLDLEDSATSVSVVTPGGARYSGRVMAVGTDHLELDDHGAAVVIPVMHVAAVELPR
jgi:hypothetical protein